MLRAARNAARGVTVAGHATALHGYHTMVHRREGTVILTACHASSIDANGDTTVSAVLLRGIPPCRDCNTVLSAAARGMVQDGCMIRTTVSVGCRISPLLVATHASWKPARPIAT